MNVPPDLLEQFCWEIRRSFRDLASAADVELKPLGITAGDRAILEFLAREPGPISLSDLARKRSVSRQHIHQSLRRLPNPGWIEELARDGDQRQVLLRLSRSGRVFWKRVRGVDEGLFARLAPQFQPDELLAAMGLLRRLRGELSNGNTEG